MFFIYKNKYLLVTAVFAILSISTLAHAQDDQQNGQDEFSTFDTNSLNNNFTEPSNDLNFEDHASSENFSTDSTSNLESTENLNNADSSSTDGLSLDDYGADEPSNNVNNYSEQNFSDQNLAGPVSYEKVGDLTLPYKKRRNTHGVLFSLTFEDFYPPNYISIIDQEPIDNFLDGNAAHLMGAEIGYKYNFPLGSLALLFQYSKGSAIGSKLGYDRTLTVDKVSVSANYAADMIMDEPYVVPYIQGSLNNFDVAEDDQNFEGGNSAKMVMGYRFGLLFQLDWIEKSIDRSTHTDGLKSSGLQNTYLDVFVNNYVTPSNVLSSDNADGEADVFAEAQLGLGLKMEF